MEKLFFNYINLSPAKQFSIIIFLSLGALALEILFKEIAIAHLLKITRVPIFFIGLMSFILMIFRIFKPYSNYKKNINNEKNKSFKKIIYFFSTLLLLPISFVLIYFVCSSLIGIFLGVWDFRYVYLVHFSGKFGHAALLGLFGIGGMIIFYNTIKMIIYLIKR
tara:strand:- start:196 stop:687 length:492 start_codon:yes stop_codon:yes gene_type:complete